MDQLPLPLNDHVPKMSSALSLVLFVASPCRGAVRLSARRGRCHYSATPPRAEPPPPLSLFYNDQYQYPLPDGHRFPMGKYRQVRRRLQQTLSAASLATFTESPLCSLEDLATTHCPDYARRFTRGELSPAENRAIGFPWSRQGVDRALSSTGGTVAAMHAVMAPRASAPQASAPRAPQFAGQIAGGTHHAHRARGEGFCVFSDIAVAANCALRDYGGEDARRPLRVAVVDLDVHQGNGNAVLFADEPRVATLSVHCAGNFFSRRERSDVDVDVREGAGDDEYLEAVRGALGPFLDRYIGGGDGGGGGGGGERRLVFFQAGVDVLEADRLGKLRVSRDGLRRRNALVYEAALAHDARLVVTMGGGYPRDLALDSPSYGEVVGAHADVYIGAAQALARHYERGRWRSRMASS